MSTTSMLIRLDSQLKDKMQKLAQAEGKNATQVLRELIENYIAERDMSSTIDQLWGRIGTTLKARDVKPRDISRAIKAARANK